MQVVFLGAVIRRRTSDSWSLSCGVTVAAEGDELVLLGHLGVQLGRARHEANATEQPLDRSLLLEPIDPGVLRAIIPAAAGRHASLIRDARLKARDQTMSGRAVELPNRRDTRSRDLGDEFELLASSSNL
jgi:hypothetical protein